MEVISCQKRRVEELVKFPRVTGDKEMNFVP